MRTARILLVVAPGLGLWALTGLGPRLPASPVTPGASEPATASARQELALIAPEAAPQTSASRQRVEAAPTPRELPAVGPLEIRLVDGATALELEFELWQVGMEEDDTWTAGDRRVFEGRSSASGEIVVADLGAGTYRIWVPDARRRTTMPPAFAFDGRRGAVDWPVTPAGTERIHVRIRRLDGSPWDPDEIQFERRGYGSSGSGYLAPPWANPRRPRDCDNWTIGIHGGGSWGGGSHRSWRSLEHGPQGHSLGELRQAGRRLDRTYRYGLRSRSEEDAPGRVELNLEPDGYRDFVALLPTADELRSLLPAGVDAAELERLSNALVVHSIPAVVDAERLALDGLAVQTWADARLRIRLSDPAYEPVDLTWGPEDGALPRISLRPVEGE